MVVQKIKNALGLGENAATKAGEDAKATDNKGALAGAAANAAANAAKNKDPKKQEAARAKNANALQAQPSQQVLNTVAGANNIFFPTGNANVSALFSFKQDNSLANVDLKTTPYDLSTAFSQLPNEIAFDTNPTNLLFPQITDNGQKTITLPDGVKSSIAVAPVHLANYQRPAGVAPTDFVQISVSIAPENTTGQAYSSNVSHNMIVPESALHLFKLNGTPPRNLQDLYAQSLKDAQDKFGYVRQNLLAAIAKQVTPDERVKLANKINSVPTEQRAINTGDGDPKKGDPIINPPEMQESGKSISIYEVASVDPEKATEAFNKYVGEGVEEGSAKALKDAFAQGGVILIPKAQKGHKAVKKVVSIPTFTAKEAINLTTKNGTTKYPAGTVLSIDVLQALLGTPKDGGEKEASISFAESGGEVDINSAFHRSWKLLGIAGDNTDEVVMDITVGFQNGTPSNVTLVPYDTATGKVDINQQPVDLGYIEKENADPSYNHSANFGGEVTKEQVDAALRQLQLLPTTAGSTTQINILKDTDKEAENSGEPVGASSGGKSWWQFWK